MNKTMKSVLALTLVTALLVPASLLKTNTKNTKHVNPTKACYIIDPPSVTE